MVSEVTPAQSTTAVVRRRIKTGSEARFESLMREFIAFALQQPGHLSINVIRPTANSRDYTVLDQFASGEERRRFTESSEYRAWMQRLRDVSDAEPEIEELGGLSFWFDLPNRSHRKPPSRMKMALLTLLGVYPLSLAVPAAVIPFSTGWPSWLVALLIASLMVIALTWVVMPAITRAFEAWLFPSKQRD